MFVKSFNLIFGVGAGVVATLTLGFVVIRGGFEIVDWIESQRAESEFRTIVCQGLPEVMPEGKAYFMDTKALTDEQAREQYEYLQLLARQRTHLSKIRIACSN